MLKLKVVHEDVFIKLFTHSLDGETHDWCRSHLIACITSLRHFHVSFHFFCKEELSVDFLYQECCYEFDLLSKGSDIHIEYAHVEMSVAVEDNFHNDQEVYTLQNNMLSNEDEIEVDKQDVESSHAIIIYDYYEFEDLFSLTTNHEDQLSFIQMALEISEGILHQL